MLTLLGFAIEGYRHQLREGRHFVHEHPAHATSWREAAVLKLRADPRVAGVVGDQCRYGLRARGSDGRLMPALKPTRFLSSSPFILEELSLRCRGVHRHQQLIGGRASAAAVYPPGLCRAILRGAQAQWESDCGRPPAAVLQAVESGTGLYDLSVESESICHRMLSSVAQPSLGGAPEEVQVDSDVPQSDLMDEDAALQEYGGADAGLERSEQAVGEFWDENTGAALPGDLVRAARQEEVSFMEGWKCWERVTWDEAVKRGGRKPIAPDGLTSIRVMELSRMCDHGLWLRTSR